MAQWVEAFVIKPDLSWIPGIHMMDRENPTPESCPLNLHKRATSGRPRAHKTKQTNVFFLKKKKLWLH